MYKFGSVALEPLRKSNNYFYQQMRNHESVRSWCRQNNLIQSDMQNDWFERVIKDPTTRMYEIKGTTKRIDDFGVVVKTELLVGVCGLTSIDYINSRAEFSLYIGHSYQRQGFAKDALKALLEVAFNEVNLNGVWGETFEGNHALNLFEKLGMKKEGTRRQFYFKGGKYIDAHLVSITREEWRNCSLEY